MKANTIYPQIEDLKNQIINQALIISTVLGTIAYLLSLTRYPLTGFEVTFVTDLIILSLLLVATILRNKLSIILKCYISISAIYITFLTDLIKLGVFSANKVLIIIIPFLALISLPKNKAIGIFIFTIFTFIIISYFHKSGILTAPPQDNISFAAYLINLLLIVTVSSIIIIIQTKYNSTYAKFITELEQKNAQLSEKERNYREIFNASTDAIFVHDLAGNILDVNNSMLKIYGYEPEDIPILTIENISSLTEGYTKHEISEYVQKAVNGEPQLFDWYAKKKNGVFFWVEVALKKSMIGDHERILAIVRDINEKKEDNIQLEIYRNHLRELVAQKTEELEMANEELHVTNENLSKQREELISTLDTLQTTQQQLIQSEKMASLGVLTAGVAHEINNPLNFISGGIQGLEIYLKDNLIDHDEGISPLINAVNVGVKRVTDIVSSLNHYSRRDDLPLNACNINSIIDNCLVMLNNQFKDRIEVIKEYTWVPHTIACSEGKIHQALINIIVNAGQSILNTGTITIKTSISDNFLIVSVRDTGSGISKEILGKIFDPFFTTKDPGKGTGLGLSITYNIIREHQGFIEIESEEGIGTNTIIRLPITDKSPKES